MTFPVDQIPVCTCSSREVDEFWAIIHRLGGPAASPGTAYKIETAAAPMTVTASTDAPEKHPRPSWERYFIELARVVASRSTCDRLKVGVVLVRDRRILATGYNGSMPGSKHCSDVGHAMLDGHCVRTVHAEVNALAHAARFGVSTEEAIAYATHSPCFQCYKTLASAGVKVIIFDETYGRWNDVEHTIYGGPDILHWSEIAGRHGAHHRPSPVARP
jgi:dCMP deaminase